MREYTKREFPTRLEAKPKARTLINKKKFYGIKLNIKEYQKKIIEHFYKKQDLDNLIKGEKSLSEKITDYFNGLTNYESILEKARELFKDSFIKGAKRVLNNSGDKIDVAPEEFAESSIELIINQQKKYLEDLTKVQKEKVNGIIKQGINNGQPNEEIAKEIKSSIKKITNVRAMRIARTEIVKVHTIAQTQTLKKAEIEKYNYITANDHKVCPICKKYQGPKGREKIYKTELAGTIDNPLPVINSHPNCRCVIVAYL